MRLDDLLEQGTTLGGLVLGKYLGLFSFFLPFLIHTLKVMDRCKCPRLTQMRLDTQPSLMVLVARGRTTQEGMTVGEIITKLDFMSAATSEMKCISLHSIINNLARMWDR